MQGRKLFAARTRLTEWLLIAVMLGGCSGTQGSSSSTGSGGSVSGIITPTSPTTSSSGSESTVIAFQGVPPLSATVGTRYSFQPTVSSGSAVITFAISGQPPWIAFDTRTGALSGTPRAMDEGTTGHIVITASSASSSTSMTPFTIRVNSAVVATSPSAAGSAVLSWAAPTENADGSPVNDLAGYRIYYGTSATELTKSVDVAGAGSTTYVLQGLPAGGRYYFSVVAYNSTGLGSNYSNLASTVL